MKTKQLLSAVLATLSLGVAHSAEFYQGPAVGNLYINMTTNFNAVSVTGYTGAGGQFSGQFYNGEMDSFLRFFCIELNQYAGVPGPFPYLRIDAYNNVNIQKLYDVAYVNPTTGDFWNGSQTNFGAFTDSRDETAFQLAIWEIISGDATLNLTTGDFKGKAIAGSGTWANTADDISYINDKALGWLNAVSSYSGTGYAGWELYRLSSDQKQDYVSATYGNQRNQRNVPEPGSLALAALALGGLGLASRRRRG